MSSVKVAVRVRPFNGREKEANSGCIIRMEDKGTYIKDPVSYFVDKTDFLKENIEYRKLVKKKSSLLTIRIGLTMAMLSPIPPTDI